MKAVHYNNALNPQKFDVPLCNAKGAKPITTGNRYWVTCKRCRKLLGL